MKPILIILVPAEYGPEVMVRGLDNLKRNESLANDYHLLAFIYPKDEIEFKLLNGTKENYDQLPELIELYESVKESLMA
jgi:hypothetical protein